MPKRSWKQKRQDIEISQAVIADKSTEELKKLHDFVTRLKKYKATTKLENTYIGGIKKAIAYNEEDKVYCSYNFDGTVTGRMSCSKYSAGAGKPMGISYHTLPRQTEYNIRSTTVAPPGHVFITADEAAMELRILSHIAKEKRMQTAFQDKDDLHWYTAELIHGIVREFLTKEDRQQAKETSFLVVFGGSAAALAPKIGKSVQEAGLILAAWNQAYPAISGYKEYVYDFIKENRYAYSLFGRKRHLLNVKSPSPRIRDHALRQGMNFTIQSVASDILLCALLGIDNSFKARNMKSRIVQTVHDSGEFIVPYAELGKAIEIIRYNMVAVPIMEFYFGLKLDVPLEVEFVCGKSFGDGLSFEKGETPNVEQILEYMHE